MASSIKSLAKYRYERSSEELENAKAMLEYGKYKLAIFPKKHPKSSELPPKCGNMPIMRTFLWPPARTRKSRCKKQKSSINLFSTISVGKVYYSRSTKIAKEDIYPLVESLL